MEMTKLKKQFTTLILKYKYVILIAMIGIVLMLLPSSNDVPKNTEQNQKIISEQSSIQEELENILSQIEGAGEVRVMLTERTGRETIYQTNNNISDSSGKIDTVVVTDSSRNESGLVKQINPPQYFGAIVLCHGADNPSVKFAVADAVSKITGLGLDKIAVLKMK